ncbi:Moesin [Platysternon megacephalum]|uniref:Moesin n=1 Tax=Platysternon megacephalum TaxID=55544 RepID=A0A4D9EX71_9SAUR|nr:Moesin [Platysternon megacephalum]
MTKTFETQVGSKTEDVGTQSPVTLLTKRRRGAQSSLYASKAFTICVSARSHSEPQAYITNNILMSWMGLSHEAPFSAMVPAALNQCRGRRGLMPACEDSVTTS